MKQILLFAGLVLGTGPISAQQSLFSFGEEFDLQQSFSGEAAIGAPVNWIQVNTEANTWKVRGQELICSGHPIGVIRSEKRYENFLLHIEWKHMEAGGNSGTFVWSDAEPGDNRLPNGVEVQMLELDWIKLNTR